MEFHEVANIFPMMSTDEYKNLIDDIRKNGLIQPIITYQDKIIDGRNRYNACKEIGIEPDYKEWNGNGDLVSFVISLNLHRRHLNESQRSIIAARIKPMFEEAAKKRQQSGLVQNRSTVSANLQKREEPVHSAEQAAKLLNVSTRSAESGSRVLEHGTPELVQAVETGEIKVSTAATLTKLPQEQQKEILSQGKEAVLKTTKAISTKESKKRIKELTPDLSPRDRANLEKRKNTIELAEKINQAARKRGLSRYSGEIRKTLNLSENQIKSTLQYADTIKQFPDLLDYPINKAVQIAAQRRQDIETARVEEECRAAIADRDPRPPRLDRLYGEIDKIFCDVKREGFDAWGAPWVEYCADYYTGPKRALGLIVELQILADGLGQAVNKAIKISEEENIDGQKAN
ncbi:MAG TPA: ParB/RepB/Spo0J family partition protein [Syntrophomonas sp.]|nr:ParB/RepB/Spo0J family partition protein [Syntrophomonas sp.]